MVYCVIFQVVWVGHPWERVAMLWVVPVWRYPSRYPVQ